MFDEIDELLRDPMDYSEYFDQKRKWVTISSYNETKCRYASISMKRVYQFILKQAFQVFVRQYMLKSVLNRASGLRVTKSLKRVNGLN